MKRIELHGVLADKFGAYFDLVVDSAKEATHAIACQLPEFKKFMLSSEHKGLRFAVFADDKNLALGEIGATTRAKVIHIVPVVTGAGGNGGLFQLIIGAALVTTGFLMGGNPYLISMGAGLMIGGAASLLMPSPKVEPTDEDGNRPNYGFGGANTTTSVGNVVGLLYGEREVGGGIGSAGIYVEDRAL